MTTTLDLHENINLFSNQNKNKLDLVVYYCGTQNCKLNKNWNSIVSDHYLIHYILDGCGTFHTKEKTYSVKKNQGFLISPNISASFRADEYNPWKYIRIDFNGLKVASYLKACNLNEDNPIFKFESLFIKECFENINATCTFNKVSEIRLTGLVYLFLSELIEQSNNAQMIKSSQDIYLMKSIEYIKKNYSQNITIENIARNLGLSRNYFSTLFKNKLNISPKEYLTEYRIEKACELLQHSNLSIKEISFYIGYTDSLYFSKAFKKVKGCSPQNYKTCILQPNYIQTR